LATHKCVATPGLRTLTTGIDKYLRHQNGWYYLVDDNKCRPQSLQLSTTIKLRPPSLVRILGQKEKCDEKKSPRNVAGYDIFLCEGLLSGGDNSLWCIKLFRYKYCCTKVLISDWCKKQFQKDFFECQLWCWRLN